MWIARRLPPAGPVLAAACAALALAPAAATAAPTLSVSPRSARLGTTVRITGTGWTVFESCSRRVRVALRSAQNDVTIARPRLRDDGAFTLRWRPSPARIGAGRWRVVTFQRCESGRDGSVFYVRRFTPLTLRA